LTNYRVRRKDQFSPYYGYKKRKRRQRIILLLIVGVCLLSWFYKRHIRYAYAIYVSNSAVAYLKNKKEAKLILARILKEETKGWGREAKFKEKVEIKRVKLDKEDRLETKEIARRRLSNLLTVMVKANQLCLDDKPVVALRREVSARSVLEELKTKFAAFQQPGILKRIDFKGKVEVKEGYVKADEIKDKKTALQVLTRKMKGGKTHQVEKGEVAGRIARKYHLSLVDLQRANPGVNLDKLFIGQTLKISESKPALIVVAQKKASSLEETPFSTVQVLDNNLFKDQTRTIRVGEKGEKRVVYLVTYENNQEVSREKVSEEIIKRPVEQRVGRGTKERE